MSEYTQKKIFDIGDKVLIVSDQAQDCSLGTVVALGIIKEIKENNQGYAYLLSFPYSVCDMAESYLQRPEKVKEASTPEAVEVLEGILNDFAQGSVNLLFSCKIDELHCTSRAVNCLHEKNIYYIGDLVQLSERDLMKVPKLGQRSIGEIKLVLNQRGLELDMDIGHWVAPRQS